MEQLLRTFITIISALVIFSFFSPAVLVGADKNDGGIEAKTGKMITITGVGHNTKDGIYLNDYVIDDFQLPDSAEGKKIKLEGILKKVSTIKPTPTHGGEIVQTREGDSTHLSIDSIKWQVIGD